MTNRPFIVGFLPWWLFSKSTCDIMKLPEPGYPHLAHSSHSSPWFIQFIPYCDLLCRIKSHWKSMKDELWRLRVGQLDKYSQFNLVIIPRTRCSVASTLCTNHLQNFDIYIYIYISTSTSTRDIKINIWYMYNIYIYICTYILTL